MRSDPKGFSEVSAPLTAEAQALGEQEHYDLGRAHTSTPPREPTFWLSEAAAEHSRTGSSGPARPLRAPGGSGHILPKQVCGDLGGVDGRCVRLPVIPSGWQKSDWRHPERSSASVLSFYLNIPRSRLTHLWGAGRG